MQSLSPERDRRTASWPSKQPTHRKQVGLSPLKSRGLTLQILWETFNVKGHICHWGRYHNTYVIACKEAATTYLHTVTGSLLFYPEIAAGIRKM